MIIERQYPSSFGSPEGEHDWFDGQSDCVRHRPGGGFDVMAIAMVGTFVDPLAEAGGSTLATALGADAVAVTVAVVAAMVGGGAAASSATAVSVFLQPRA